MKLRQNARDPEYPLNFSEDIRYNDLAAVIVRPLRAAQEHRERFVYWELRSHGESTAARIPRAGPPPGASPTVPAAPRPPLGSGSSCSLAFVLIFWQFGKAGGEVQVEFHPWFPSR